MLNNDCLSLLVLKSGKSNEAVKRYLDKNNILYDTIPKKNKYDYIIKPPGMKKEDVLVEGRIICDIELAYMLKRPFIYGVTGTSGKTTCTLLIQTLLEEKYKTQICGNIGIPIFDVLDEIKRIYIVELSSFELDSTIKFKPRIGVILNINEAHLDYHNSMNNYINAKAKITVNQDKNDFLIYNFDDDNVRRIVDKSKAIKLSISMLNREADAFYENGIIYTKYGNVNINEAFSYLDGDIYNMMGAILVALLSNVSIKMIENKLKKFRKPHYRMELVEKNIYNDSKSTNIFSTLTQIKHLNDITLICGGYDRKNSLDNLIDVAKYVDVFYLYGANRNRVAQFLAQNNLSFVLCETLEEAVSKALKKYKLLVFSPMAPSYDEFSSYEERGAYFNELIKKYLPM